VRIRVKDENEGKKEEEKSHVYESQANSDEFLTWPYRLYEISLVGPQVASPLLTVPDLKLKSEGLKDLSMDTLFRNPEIFYKEFRMHKEKV